MVKEITGIKLYDVSEISDCLSLSQLTVREYLKSKKLKGRKIGVKWYVTQENIEKFVKSSSNARKKRSLR